MILFPRPRIPLVIALALAIPTWGLSLVVFYFGFKRPYDSTAVSAILAEAKRSMESRRAGGVVNVNRGGIERVFNKFSDPAMALKYGEGVPFVRWGVLRHPMLNDGQPFSLRVNRQGDAVQVEASPGEAWWLLTERVWLGRRGSSPGLPESMTINGDDPKDDAVFTDADSAAMGLLFLELAHREVTVELPSLTYGRLNEFVDRTQIGGEWFPNYAGMRFYFTLNNRKYGVRVENVDATKEDEGAVRVTAGFSE